MIHFLEAKNITKEYGNDAHIIRALNGVSFHIERGSFTAITGRSGSGKTTLLKIMAGLEVPTSGEVRINGVNISEMSEDERTVYRRSHIGYIFQEYNLISSLNIMDNLILPVQLNGDKPDKNLFQKVVHFLELDTKLEAMPHMLSGGQQQRAAIARALLVQPEIILADEPTGNLDTESGNRVLSLMKEAVALFNRTLVIITHDREVAGCADKCLHIENGKII